MISLTKAPRIAIVRPRHMSINVTELARRLKVPTHELLEKLPELGLVSAGALAIKVNDKEANDIARAWPEVQARRPCSASTRAQEREDRRKGAVGGHQDQAIQLPAVLSVRDFCSNAQHAAHRGHEGADAREGVFANANDRIDFDTASMAEATWDFTLPTPTPPRREMWWIKGPIACKR